MLKPVKKELLFVVVVMLLCAVLGIYYHYVRVHELAARYQYECSMHLVDLWDITMGLAKDQDRFPEDLTAITKKVPISQYNARWRLHPVLCPGPETPFDPDTATLDSFGYSYINWSTRSFAHIIEVPGDYPLAYDRKLSNHSGRGVFVLQVNGRVMWDPGAEWVRDFSVRHPEFHIPIPQ
jgi:hypothetical protein